jgi:hypothetical protein
MGSPSTSSDFSGIYTLSVEGKELGLVQGFCDVCGRPLVLKLSHLECRQCRRSYRKKISVHYQRPEFLKKCPIGDMAIKTRQSHKTPVKGYWENDRKDEGKGQLRPQRQA